MFSIAKELGAKVQGDECEIYDENGKQVIEAIQPESEVTNTKWWQFWK